MKSVLGISARKPKPSPLEGSGNFRILPDGSSPQKISRHEWWLWFSALFVTFLSAVAFVLSSIHSFFRHADYFYEIRSDQARWATLCLVLVFNAWLVYRQWSFRRLRKLAAGFANDAQSVPPQVLELAGLDPVTGLCTRSNSVFGKRRDENDWYAATLRDQSILKFKPAHTRHLHVGDQTGTVVDPRRAQEVLGRFEDESDETKRPQKALHCRAN